MSVVDGKEPWVTLEESTGEQTPQEAVLSGMQDAASEEGLAQKNIREMEEGLSFIGELAGLNSKKFNISEKDKRGGVQFKTKLTGIFNVFVNKDNGMIIFSSTLEHFSDAADALSRISKAAEHDGIINPSDLEDAKTFVKTGRWPPIGSSP